MKKKIQIGDTVSLRSAILFGLETYIRHHMNANLDADFHVGTVTWGREDFGQDEAENTIISFIEPPKPVEIERPPKNSEVRQYPWTIYIQGMLRDSFANPTYPAYEIVAEVKRILNSLIAANSGMNSVDNFLNLGPAAQRERGNRNNLYGMMIGSETVRGPGDHSRFTYFWLPLHLDLVEDLNNPRVLVQDPL